MVLRIPPELVVVFLGALPISEARGAIPAGMLLWQFSALKAYALAVAGNLLPIVPLLIFLRYFVDTSMHRWYWANRFFSWLFARTRRIHGDHFHSFRWAPLALFLFVAIPLPFTGAWSGVVAAVVFGIPFWHAAGMIALGAMAAGGIVTALVSFGLLTVHSLFQSYEEAYCGQLEDESPVVRGCRKACEGGFEYRAQAPES